jgi:hypothetical protein
MIISISGKINSGKDTVGKIIQYLTLDKEVFSMDTADIVADLDYNGYCANKSDWKIKKFADKLKDITCLLIGCSREQLEDREFKEKELGEEWWYYKHYKVRGTLDKGGYDLIPYLDNPISEDAGGFLIKLTPRLLMQLLGTECMRNIIHPNGWANTLMVDYKETAVNWDCDGNTTVKELPKWLITDTRFPNELQVVKNKKGITIRVNRSTLLTKKGEIVRDDKVYNIEDIDFKNREHPSETALDNAEFDHVIENNGTIKELIEKVKEILIKENII